MHVSVFAPSARLAPFIECFRIAELEEMTRLLLPELGLALAVHFGGSSSLLSGDTATALSGVVVAGIQGTARHLRHHGNTKIAVANFRPGAASAFFGLHLHELHGLTLPFEHTSLSDQIASAPDHASRIAILESFLIAHLTGTPDPVALAAVRAIETARGSIRIDQLAKSLGISQDPLEKRFRSAVGASPKQLASLVRIRNAVDLGHRGTSWSRVAMQSGYYDQSHFIHEFRGITGESPTRFFRARGDCGAPTRRS